jgi:hypothetical protein
MKSSLKLKFDSQTGQVKLVTADGNDIIENIETITNIEIKISATELPKVVITCLILDLLEVEADQTEIETTKTWIKR